MCNRRKNRIAIFIHGLAAGTLLAITYILIGMLLNLFSGLTGISLGNLWMVPIAPAWLILELDKQHGWGYFDQNPISSFALIITYWLIIGQLIMWIIAYKNSNEK